MEQHQKSYHLALQEIGQRVHPFNIDTLQWQFFNELSESLATPLKTLSELSHDYGGERAQKAISTFQSQVPSLAQGIHAWWQWVTNALSSETQDLEVQNWVLTALLPWVYWSQQADKTRHPLQKRCYQKATSDAYNALMNQPMTLQFPEAERQRWVDWSRWLCAQYQRTTSAVEGRNGCLSELHHSGRGFSAQSLHALTTIHNFDLKRPDGTTAAQRLFDHEFPDLFEWVLEQVGDLPMPRRSNKLRTANP